MPTRPKTPAPTPTTSTARTPAAAPTKGREAAAKPRDPAAKARDALAEARKALAGPSDGDAVEAVLTKAGTKARGHLEKHFAACDASANPERGKLWRHLMVTLNKLAPLPVLTAGSHAVQFFVPDGKYRMQAYALEDPGDGTLLVYAPDALAEAVDAGLLLPPPGQPANPPQGPRDYIVAAAKTQTLRVEPMDGRYPAEPAAHMKNMLGWNRKALRITLPCSASPAQVAAVEGLCALATREWAATAVAAAPTA